jgi:hypothetical protein
VSLDLRKRTLRVSVFSFGADEKEPTQRGGTSQGERERERERESDVGQHKWISIVYSYSTKTYFPES